MNGSREMYVEPTALLPSRGEIMIAGTPNYLYTPGGPGDARDFVQDSVFGVVVGANGQGRLIPAPIDAKRIRRIRGVVLENGNWAFSFGENKRAVPLSEPDSIVRFWYAEFDGKTWVKLEPLPIVGGGTLLTAGSSNLLVRGDSAFLAIPRATTSGPRDLALFERKAGRWTVSFPPTRGVAYALLTFSGAGELVLAIVRAGPGLGYDSNSLFVQTRRGDWSAATRLIQGHPEPIHQPHVTSAREGIVLTWQAIMPSGRRIARTMVDALAPGAPVLTLDTAVSVAIPVEGRFAAPLWLSSHVDPDRELELRFLGRADDGSAALLGAFANPYTGPFGASATGPDEVIVAGPLLRSDPPNPSLVTLFIRARVECAARAPQPDGWTLARRVYVHPPSGGLNVLVPSTYRARSLRDLTARLRQRE